MRAGARSTMIESVVVSTETSEMKGREMEGKGGLDCAHEQSSASSIE